MSNSQERKQGPATAPAVTNARNVEEDHPGQDMGVVMQRITVAKLRGGSIRRGLAFTTLAVPANARNAEGDHPQQNMGVDIQGNPVINIRRGSIRDMRPTTPPAFPAKGRDAEGDHPAEDMGVGMQRMSAGKRRTSASSERQPARSSIAPKIDLTTWRRGLSDSPGHRAETSASSRDDGRSRIPPGAGPSIRHEHHHSSRPSHAEESAKTSPSGTWENGLRRFENLSINPRGQGRDDEAIFLEKVRRVKSPWPASMVPYHSAFEYTLTHDDPRASFLTSDQLFKRQEELCRRIPRLIQQYRQPGPKLLIADHNKEIDRRIAMTIQQRKTCNRQTGVAYDAVRELETITREEMLDDLELEALSCEMISSWIKAAPSKENAKTIARLVCQVDNIMKMRFARSKLLIEPFGSASWGGQVNEDGDIDLVMRDLDRPLGYTPQYWTPEKPPNKKLPAHYNVYMIAQALRNGGFTEVQPVGRATTPIVKFKDPVSGCSLDLNTNDLGGYYNSQFILEYCKASPYLLRPFIHVIKSWAKARNLNDPSGEHGIPTLSSYSWVLICIAYLQSGGFLPNLQDPSLVAKARREDASAWVQFGKPEGQKIGIQFAPHTLAPAIKTVDSEWKSLGKHVSVFFAWMGDFLKQPQDARSGHSGREWHGNAGFSVYRGGLFQRTTPYVRTSRKAIEEENRLRNERNRAKDRAKAEAKGFEGISATLEEAQNFNSDNDNQEGSSAEPRTWKSHPLVVQDPFIHGKVSCLRYPPLSCLFSVLIPIALHQNCAAALQPKAFERLQAEVARAHDILARDGSAGKLSQLLEPAPLPGPNRKPKRAEKRAQAQVGTDSADQAKD